ncbi:MAG TPA: transporter substrate-binding domain-containing protein [Candidatus Cloacimonadota bacterium]|nr:transporter substrate-binding domain-containing protein [Candidatus Cloacimonadota bacterium]
MAAIQQELIIGGDISYPPYEYIDSKGRPSGYNVELSKIVAEELGMTPVFRLAKWNRIREDLDSGKIDLVQGMAFSTARAQTVFFSNPHTRTWRAVFVRKNSKAQSIKDLMGARILLQEGDIAKEYFTNQEFSGELIELPNQDNALHLVNSGTGDAALVNYMLGMYLVQNQNLTEVKALQGEVFPKFYCMASKDPELIERVNDVLERISSDGRLEELHAKWFGEYDREHLNISNRLRMVRQVQYYLWGLFAFTLLGLGSLFFFLSRRRRRLQRQLESKNKLYNDLLMDFTIFHRGPLIAYKNKINPYRLLYVSEGLKAWGYNPNIALAREEGFVDLVHPEDRVWLDKELDVQVTAKVESETRQFRILTKTGEIRWAMDFNLILYPENEEPVVYGYMVDITRIKQMEGELLEAREKAENANAAKDYFLASMSHEIRTPLNGILGFIQVLMQMEASPEQMEYYKIISSSGNNLMKLVNDVLDVSKIESGKMELVISEFDLTFMMKDVIKAFALNRQKSSVDVRLKLSDKLPPILYGDMMRLKQILINLLQNSMKFTEEGYIELTADIYNQSGADVRILFSVADTGIGIDPKKQTDIFDNFSQLDNSLTRRYGGTGLGLAIVKRLVELMNGFIWVESEPGEGSQFFFIIPFKKKNEVKMSSVELTIEDLEQNEKLAPLNLLLVEDELINQNATKRQLERWGLKVTVASNGAEALGLVELMDFDCVLMDIQMPVMDGVTATRKIREKEKESGKHLIIYACTALALSGDKERFIEAGMDDYISKPINLVRLYRMLQKVEKKEA